MVNHLYQPFTALSEGFFGLLVHASQNQTQQNGDIAAADGFIAYLTDVVCRQYRYHGTLPQVLCGKYGFDIRDASKLLSLAPAKLLGADDEMGSIAVGKAADLVLADSDFNVTGVFLNGKRVFA